MQSQKKSLDDFLGIKSHDETVDLEAIKKMLNLSDFEEDEWTFKIANTKEFTHTIFNEYPARMIPQVARKLIKCYYPNYENPELKKPMLDPFAGSGTSCVEALLRNLDAIAFDLNPLAHVVEKARTAIVNPGFAQKKYKAVVQFIDANKSHLFEDHIPRYDKIEFWYSKKVIQGLSVIACAINTILPDADNETNNNPAATGTKNLLLVSMGKAARDCSFQRKGENKTFRMEREKMPGFEEKVDVIKTFKAVAEEYLGASKELYDYYTSMEYSASCKAYLGNSMQLDGIADNSIDLIVTSPPYGDSQTTVAYGQFSRFPLEWIIHDQDTIKAIDDELLGGVENEQDIPESPILLATCKSILEEEMKQQANLIDKFKVSLEVITQRESDSEDNAVIEEIMHTSSECVETISSRLSIVLEIKSFEEMLNIKDEYYSLLKKFRPNGNKGNKILDTRKMLDIKTKFKIIDDRLGYVLSFYSDFMKVYQRLYEVLDFGRKCCFVTGNRTVKNIRIPTDKIIIDLGKQIGFEHITTFYRNIPNKKMPLWNSPSNVPGTTAPLMDRESIIVLEKRVLNDQS
ncbi:MAG TPA: DNA methyltransferase [Candidatus Lokiarchaeia archaeon]|nr:DNA methyltransferase [Candidatus Lokiarchaeia archaeon]